MSIAPTTESVTKTVQQVIADVTGNDLVEIHPQAELEEELGVTPVDLGRIVAELNNTLGLELDIRAIEAEDITTVQELTIIVTEEALLG